METSSYKIPVILSDFDETWISLTDFRKKLKCQVSTKSVQQHAKLAVA
jgi:hypothetical protein